MTPASSKWKQNLLVAELEEQSDKVLSVPSHTTSVMWMGPSPWPKNAPRKATASVRGPNKCV